MRCSNHQVEAEGLFYVEYLGAVLAFCARCRRGAIRDFVRVVEVDAPFLRKVKPPPAGAPSPVWDSRVWTWRIPPG